MQLIEQFLHSRKKEFQQSQAPRSERIVQMLTQLLPWSSQVPYPAEGETYQRWKILSQIAAIDLSMAKIFESHLDALAILHELQHAADNPEKLYAVWAAEGSEQPLKLNTQQQISGIKNWCSAAQLVDFGLMTFQDQQQKSQLALVHMQHPKISLQHDVWHAVGMRDTRTTKLSFEQVPIQLIGQPNDYLQRAGFWHGAAGVAACWYGAAVSLVDVLCATVKSKPHAFKQMYLGEIHCHLQACKSMFLHTASQIDQQPESSHELLIRALRAQVEHAVGRVLDLVGRALGAAPFCFNEDFAQTHADLTVFVRQSHAAFDLECIAQLTEQESISWQL